MFDAFMNRRLQAELSSLAEEKKSLIKVWCFIIPPYTNGHTSPIGIACS